MLDKVFSVLNSNASEIFLDLIVFQKYFQEPILSFIDEHIFISTLFLPETLIEVQLTSDFGKKFFQKGFDISPLS